MWEASEDVARFESLEQLRDAVVEAGGVLTTRMEFVRDAYGKGRLGVHVRDNISKSLAGLGLGHFPRALPDRQWALVRIYKMGSPIADLIDAVLEPSPAHDSELKQAMGGGAAAILAQVKELVCN
jgi:hypothetical protein